MLTPLPEWHRRHLEERNKAHVKRCKANTLQGGCKFAPSALCYTSESRKARTVAQKARISAFGDDSKGKCS